MSLEDDLGEMDDRTYGVGVKCSNCGYEGSAAIPVGTAVLDHPCPTCGCAAMSRRSWSTGRVLTDEEWWEQRQDKMSL